MADRQMHSRKERRAKKKIDAAEMNRFRVLVDMLEHDLEEFQLCDPVSWRLLCELACSLILMC